MPGGGVAAAAATRQNLFSRLHRWEADGQLALEGSRHSSDGAGALNGVLRDLLAACSDLDAGVFAGLGGRPTPD
ncbi:hypothetical protein DIPPA_06484 [Diplonema papillatum]|nr:hypothetical protein DIPPA_06484 [Diplonema papillatum]